MLPVCLSLLDALASLRLADSSTHLDFLEQRRACELEQELDILRGLLERCEGRKEAKNLHIVAVRLLSSC